MLIQRVQAAEGFKVAAEPVRRERYGVIISGVIQTIHSLAKLWMVSPFPS